MQGGRTSSARLAAEPDSWRIPRSTSRLTAVHDPPKARPPARSTPARCIRRFDSSVPGHVRSAAWRSNRCMPATATDDDSEIRKVRLRFIDCPGADDSGGAHRDGCRISSSDAHASRRHATLAHARVCAQHTGGPAGRRRTTTAAAGSGSSIALPTCTRSSASA